MKTLLLISLLTLNFHAIAEQVNCKHTVKPKHKSKPDGRFLETAWGQSKVSEYLTTESFEECLEIGKESCKRGAIVGLQKNGVEATANHFRKLTVQFYSESGDIQKATLLTKNFCETF